MSLSKNNSQKSVYLLLLLFYFLFILFFNIEGKGRGEKKPPEVLRISNFILKSQLSNCFQFSLTIPIIKPGQKSSPAHWCGNQNRILLPKTEKNQ